MRSRCTHVRYLILSANTRTLIVVRFAPGYSSLRLRLWLRLRNILDCLLFPLPVLLCLLFVSCVHGLFSVTIAYLLHLLFVSCGRHYHTYAIPQGQYLSVPIPCHAFCKRCSHHACMAGQGPRPETTHGTLKPPSRGSPF